MPEHTATTETSLSTNGHRAGAPASGIAEQTAPSSTPAQQFLCPYCGYISESPTRCDHCKGLFEPLSRQATQNQMGPWQLRDSKNPFQPGCSFATLKLLIGRGRVTRNTILRGPTTRQFWSFACNAPGVAVLLGECHSCHTKVKTDEYMCATCNAVLSPPTDRQHLGLTPVKLLPGQAPAAAVASSSMAPPTPSPAAEASRHARHATPHHAKGAPRPAPGPVRTATAKPTSKPQAAKTRPATRPAPDAGRETVRRLRERVRFMTGALIFAGIILVVMMVLFAVTMLSGSSSLRFGRPPAPNPAPATQLPAQPLTPVDDEPTPIDQTNAHSDASEGLAPDLADVEKSSAPGAADGASPSPAASALAASFQGLDSGLGAWSVDIKQAGDLERKDTVEDLEAGVAILQRVLKEATSAAIDAGQPEPTFPLLQARIDRLTERIDRLKLRDVFD